MATYKTAVEHYVRGMLRTHGLGTLPLIYIQKVMVLIDRKLDNPCCTDSDATIDLLTSKPNVFADTVERLLNAIPKNGNVKSLERTKDIIQRRLDCCQIVT